MLEDAADDLRLFDAGDDLHRPAAVLAGFERALNGLHPHADILSR